MLVKAVTLYPAGTVRRWETSAGFVNTHSPEGSREKTARQVLSKVKALQKLDTSEKLEVNKLAFSRFAQDHVKRGHVEAAPTERYGTAPHAICAVHFHIIVPVISDIIFCLQTVPSHGQLRNRRC